MLDTSFLATGGIVSDEDIKRQLGVGTATLSDHLREYKDPFEPSDPVSVATGRKSISRSSCCADEKPTRNRFLPQYATLPHL